MNEQLARACRHLSRRDAVLRPLIRRVGPCLLEPQSDLFGALVSSIISQQISFKAARSIIAKVIAGPCRGKLTARAIVRASDDELRGAGLSGGKMKSLRDLAEKVVNRELRLDRMPELDDDEVTAQLLPVHGIGEWTAHMFLMFSLCRLNVLPVGDLGLKTAMQRLYGLPELPRREKIIELAAPWQPYCSVATWYMWRSLDTKEKQTCNG